MTGSAGSTARTVLDKLFSDWPYTFPSAALHTVWFVAWFALGLSINLLTLVVSLEAIYLCLGLGIAQRHHADDLHDHIESSG